MELLPSDAWALFSRRAGVVYAFCILAALATYAYTNRIAPMACLVSLAILALVFVAFLLLAGTSGQTWTDTSNALAFLLIALAFSFDGIFIAGASTFGPVPILDVGVTDWSGNPNHWYFWLDGRWIEAKLPERMTADEHRKFQSWSGNLALTNDLNRKPGRIQISMWDRQIYRVTMKNWTPPTTIGESPHARLRAFLELFCGLALLVFSFLVWQEGRERGVRYRGYNPLEITGSQLRR
jgi:hypothetical protein